MIESVRANGRFWQTFVSDLRHRSRPRVPRDGEGGSAAMGAQVDGPLPGRARQRLYELLARRHGLQRPRAQEPAGPAGLAQRPHLAGAREARTGLLRRRARVRRHQASRSRR